MSCVPDSLQLQGVSSQSSEAILIISFIMMHAFLQSLSEVGKSVVGGHSNAKPLHLICYLALTC